MGEIIIKVPGDVREEIEVELGNRSDVIRKVERVLSAAFLKANYRMVRGSVKAEDVSEHELHIQED